VISDDHHIRCVERVALRVCREHRSDRGVYHLAQVPQLGRERSLRDVRVEVDTGKVHDLQIGNAVLPYAADKAFDTSPIECRICFLADPLLATHAGGRGAHQICKGGARRHDEQVSAAMDLRQ
jgi:hypothetical protein